MLLDIFKDAIEYPAQDYKALLKLGLCVLASFLIIPLFLVLGYEYRILEISSKGMIGGKEPLPDFSDLVSMFVDGLKIFVVGFVYLIIPILVSLAFNLTGGGIGSFNPWVGNGIVTTGGIITIILTIIFVFISYTGTVNMVANGGSLKAAFNIPEIWKIIGKIGWIRYILFFFGYLIIRGVLLVLTFILLIILSMIFGSITSLAGFAIVGLSLGSIITSIVYIFLVQPYNIILRNRALGLIFEPLDEE